MNTPDTSQDEPAPGGDDQPVVTGKGPSGSTVRAYARDWALFTDWCGATGHTPAPTDLATVQEFFDACPAAPATRRRRWAAIEHHHRLGGHPPIVARRDPELAIRPRTPLDPGQVDRALRVIPSHGWTAGLFGRRDRALLTLAAHTDVQYRQLATMTAGQITIADGRAVISSSNGHTVEIDADHNPLVCGPCALARWQRVIDVDVRPDRQAHLPTLLARAKLVTAASLHQCGQPEPIHPRTTTAALFPPINQWGQFPYPIRPMSRHAAAALTRQTDTGLTPHRRVHVGDFLHTLETKPTAPATPPPAPVWDWAAANQRKKEAVQQLAPVADALDDIETRINQLLARARALEDEM